MTAASVSALNHAAVPSTKPNETAWFHGRAMPRNAQYIQRQFESETGSATRMKSASFQRATRRPRAKPGKV